MFYLDYETATEFYKVYKVNFKKIFPIYTLRSKENELTWLKN